MMDAGKVVEHLEQLAASATDKDIRMLKAAIQGFGWTPLRAERAFALMILTDLKEAEP